MTIPGKTERQKMPTLIVVQCLNRWGKNFGRGKKYLLAMESGPKICKKHALYE